MPANPSVDYGARKDDAVKTIDDVLAGLITFLEAQMGPVSFDAIHDYMRTNALSFGSGIGTIDMLEIEAYRTGTFDVDRDRRTVYPLDGAGYEIPPQATVQSHL
jgi:hypothetical protein